MALTATTIALAGLALTAVGTGVAVAGQQGAAAAQEKSAEYNAAVAENNAIAQRHQSEFEANRAKKRIMLSLGRQRAVAGKSGIEGGSFEDIYFDSSLEGQQEIEAIMYRGRIASNAQLASADLSRFEGRNARTAGNYRTAGTLLTGAGNVAGQYNQMNNPRFSGYDD